MRYIHPPNMRISQVYDECTKNIQDMNLHSRLIAIKDHIIAAADDYRNKANSISFFKILPNESDNNQFIIGNVTKKELKNLYDQQMVARNKPARKFYDALVSSAPLGKCPFCSIGDASTLDHYLPKSKFPMLSILPLNLIPSCKDCNTGKSNIIALVEQNQTLHPYFDSQKFISNQWIFANVIESNPATINFYVKTPDNWDNISKIRVNTHFENYKLASRFSIQAANELSTLRETLKQCYANSGTSGVCNHLSMMAISHSQTHANSWQTAMYQALSNNEWFCEYGF